MDYNEKKTMVRFESRLNKGILEALKMPPVLRPVAQCRLDSGRPLRPFFDQKYGGPYDYHMASHVAEDFWGRSYSYRTSPNYMYGGVHSAREFGLTTS
uniref:Uncharacterized protein n=1 Tax=Romanomermis culicivorax TaxID=13658 RepID=A0A915JFP6_ROMCU